MSDVRLRDQLERESHRVSLEPGAADRMFESRARRERRTRAGTAVVGLALAAAVVALVVTSFPGRDREHVITDASAVAGTYETRLSSRDPDVARLNVGGIYDLTLTADGSLELNGPWDVNLPGPPTTFSVKGDEFTTDLLVGFGCDNEGNYRWSLEQGQLTLTPLADSCGFRAVLLGTRSWSAIDPGPAPDALQGDWTATYSCEEIVAAVERSEAPPAFLDQWRSAYVELLSSPDEDDPCAGSPLLLSTTFRFTGDRLLIFDGRPEGFDGRYDLDGDVLTIRDPRSSNIQGEYQVRVTFGDDVLRFELLGDAAAEPFFTGAWETAPFVRRR